MKILQNKINKKNLKIISVSFFKLKLFFKSLENLINIIRVQHIQQTLIFSYRRPKYKNN
jgi:hypothetical protein